MSAAQRRADALRSLAYADALLSGRVCVAAGDSARLAAFIARQGVESLVDAYCIELGAPCARARMSAKLAIIKSQGEADHAQALSYAWNHLSACCHEHSYELGPTVAEVRNLCLTVMDQVGLA